MLPPGYDPFVPARICRRVDSILGKDLDFEIRFLEPVLEKNPADIEVLVFLSHAYTTCGRYGDGLRLDHALSHLRPRDPIVQYNLACSYALLRKTEEAIETLEKAVALGYRDFEYMAKDDDLKGLRDDARFQGLLRGPAPRPGKSQKA